MPKRLNLDLLDAKYAHVVGYFLVWLSRPLSDRVVVRVVVKRGPRPTARKGRFACVGQLPPY